MYNHTLSGDFFEKAVSFFCATVSELDLKPKLFIRTNPNIRLHIHGNPRIKCDAIPTVIISQVQGKSANRRTAHDNFRNFTISKPRPALVSMTVRAIFLQRYKKTFIFGWLVE